MTDVLLLPLIREHIAAVVQAERERSAEILDGCNERTSKLAERADKAESAIERVRSVCEAVNLRAPNLARDVLAALDATEGGKIS